MTAKLRTYPKYKPSGIDWLGDIPEEWEVWKLKHVARQPIKNGLGEPAEHVDESWPRYIRITDIETPRSLKKHTFRSLPKDLARKALVKPGDLLLAAVGATFGGSYLHTETRREFCYAGYLVKFSPNEKVYPSFAGYWTESTIYWNQLRANVIQATIQNFSAAKYKELLFLLPPPKTQKRIADFLDEKTKVVDELVAKKEKLIELLREKRAALITRAVTKGLNPNAKLKSSGIDWLGDIPVGWGICRIRFLVQTNPSKSEIANFSNQPVSFLPMSYVSENGALDLSEERDLNFIYTGYTYFRDGDVILAKITPCFENGKGAFISGLTNGIGFGSTEFHVFRPKKIDGKFLYYFFASDGFMRFGELNMKGTAGQKRVPELFIKDFVMGVSKAKEQKRIADFLDTETAKVDKATALIESQIEKLKEYRSSLIYHAVTGKIKI